MTTHAEFEVFYLQYYRLLCQFLHTYTFLRADTESLAHDVFLELFQKWDRIPKEKRKNWLYQRARYRGLDFIRNTRRLVKRHNDAQEQDALPMSYEASRSHEEAMIDREQRRLSLKLLLALPEKQSTLLELHSLGYSYKEMAEILDVKSSSISRMLIVAKKAIRSLYKEYQGL